ncbi:hypothetical protein V7S43_010527 [Phytophthora oleae]|uniref:Uncharacterized protein n=1 Tax=Phytophthora oleae TaxID=2107226 RepID=A0ABD3FBT9_9STRA
MSSRRSELRLSLRQCKSVQSSFCCPAGRDRVFPSAVLMTLTELPEEVVKVELDHATRAGRKRPRSDSSRLNVEAVDRPRVEDVPIPPIRVDKDLLIQVLRVKVQTLIRNAKLREGQEQQSGKKHDPQCTAERLEKLLPVIEQRWLQDLMNGDEPRYGFDEVVKVFQDIVHTRDSGVGENASQ